MLCTKVRRHRGKFNQRDDSRFGLAVYKNFRAAMLPDYRENDSQVQRTTLATVRNSIKLATSLFDSNYTNYEDSGWIGNNSSVLEVEAKLNKSGADLNTSHSMNGNVDDDYCSAYVNFKYDPLLLAACGIFLMIGLIYSFFGYRLYKIVLFSTGFLYGSILLYLLCEKERLLDNSYYNALVACFIGLLVGLITCLVQYIGIFMLGFSTGLLLGLLTLLTWVSTTAATLSNDRPWLAVLGMFFVCGLILALLSLKFQKFCLKFCSSLLGGFFLLLFVDYLATKFQLVDEVKICIFDTRPMEWRRFCWFNWAVVAVWPAISLLGFVVQCTVTGNGFSHKSESHQQRRSRPAHSTRSSTSTAPIANGRSAASSSNIITARCTDCYLYHSAGDKCQSPTVHSSSSGNGSSSLLTSASLKRQQKKTSKFNGKSSSKQELTSSDNSQYPKKSFRYLYQARRRHGDVICQSYMESLQKLSNQRRFGATSVDLNTPTMISDRTQLTILSTGSNSNSNGSV